MTFQSIHVILPSVLLVVVAVPSSFGQFYPQGDATWCVYNNVSPDGIDYVLHMPASSDTLINGTTYQRISCPYPGWPPVFYVRSSTDGRGFMLLQGEERLTGDISTAAGDTVHGVTVLSEVEACGLGIPVVVSVVVDSVVALSNSGVNVTRHYVHTPCYTDGNFEPWSFFWQEGIGASHGPALLLSIGLSHYDLHCAMVGSSSQFNWLIEPGELPGGPPCCAPLPNSVSDFVSSDRPYAFPNPSAGIFHFTSTAREEKSIRDAQGKEFQVTTEGTIDLSSHPSGVYTAIVSTAYGSRAVRLVVVR